MSEFHNKNEGNQDYDFLTSLNIKTLTYVFTNKICPCFRVEERTVEHKKLRLFPGLISIEIDSNISPSQVRLRN